MSATSTSSRRTRRLARTRRAAATRTPAAFAGDAVFLAGLAAVGVVAAWPIYQDPWMLLTCTAAFVLAVGISALATLRRWRWWWVAAATAGAYLVTGIPLAAPAALADLSRLPVAALQIVTAPVTGWKNLLTLDLPLGTYQATLAPALLVFLVVPVISLAFAWRGRRSWVLAVPVGLAMPLFGILFGSSAVRGLLRLGPVAVPGLVELLTGVAALLIALGWYVWRTAAARGSALRRALTASGVRVRRRAPAALGRWTIAAAMTLVAVVVGLIAAPLAVAGSPREVLRTGIDPELKIARALSPLSTYREFFSDAEYDQELFQVTTDGAADRVRLATLSFYDGIVARVIDPAGAGTASAFVRVPAGSSAGASVVSTVRIQQLTGIWVPLIGSLTSISFDGSSRSALSDGFFYSANADMGVQLSDPGLVAGTTYTETSAAGTADAADIAALTPSSAGPRVASEAVPASLVDWVQAQDAAGGGAGLLTLIDRLRARGYLSHALSYDTADPPQWALDLGGDYSFEPSRAGHSTDRIGALFTDLLDRQNEVGGTDDAALVAAAGDDEQFAVAAALIADQLGFPARVVLGARLAGDDDTDLPVCEQGECRGQDMSAWIEVQDASGAWLAIDTTPQHENPIAPTIEERADPQNPTEVTPDQAETVLPPDAAPADGGQNNDDPGQSGPDLTALWAGLRVTGIVLLVALVLFGPLLGIVLAKALRRRSRRDSPDPVDRMVGGWDEYVDAAVDRGSALPGTQTRQELARLYDTESTGTPVVLAAWADRSVFDHALPAAAEGDEFWALVDDERARMLSGLGWWGRLRMRVSLRSLRRSARELTARAGGAGMAAARVIGGDRSARGRER